MPGTSRGGWREKQGILGTFREGHREFQALPEGDTGNSRHFQRGKQGIPGTSRGGLERETGNSSPNRLEFSAGAPPRALPPSLAEVSLELNPGWNDSLCPFPPAQVSLELNPGWNGSLWNGSWVNVVHVRAQGPRATLHMVWGSLGAPSVLLVASGSPRSRLGIDWARLLSPEPAGALRIHPPGSVSYAGAVAFTKVRALPSPGRSGVPPGLPWVPGGCELRLQLSGVPPRSNGSRFVLAVTALDGGARRELRPRRDLDDEFAPGVFETQSLVAQSQSQSQSHSPRHSPWWPDPNPNPIFPPRHSPWWPDPNPN
ncbi:PREDICTED: glycosylated lysosomal membrane protein, partial [Lepidothrix coronata]|uniref:Glycosylated lysosomal membrane protein n=1 Tax=Lepidothrix coronata TaxID=321398 RepID=A0A6J0J9K3_9PASS